MDLAAVMLADPGANSTQEQLLSDLMISVIERFTPWRTLSRRLADIGPQPQPLRLAHPARRQPDPHRSAERCATSNSLAREVGPVAGAFLPPVRALDTA